MTDSQPCPYHSAGMECVFKSKAVAGWKQSVCRPFPCLLSTTVKVPMVTNREAGK